MTKSSADWENFKEKSEIAGDLEQVGTGAAEKGTLISGSCIKRKHISLM